MTETMNEKIHFPEGGEKKVVNIAIDMILKIGVLILMIVLCYKILYPFIDILIWGVIFAIILFPFFIKLSGWLGKRYKLSSLLIIIVALFLLSLPSIWLVNQLVDGIKFLSEILQDENLTMTPPEESVKGWPLIGPWVYENWLDFSQHIDESLERYMPKITLWGERALGALADTGIGIISFAASIIIAGFILMFHQKGAEAGKKFFLRIAGDRGIEFLNISLRTIRNVAIGVLGVAVIQTTMMGLGLIFAHIPLTAVWILVLLIMTIAQIPALIFNIPLIIYLFTTRDPGPAALWGVYFMAMGMMDNVLKPILMGKGSEVPMLVIFLGAIGGFAGYGFIGLFLGAIILSLIYKLYLAWVSMKL